MLDGLCHSGNTIRRALIGNVGCGHAEHQLLHHLLLLFLSLHNHAALFFFVGAASDLILTAALFVLTLTMLLRDANIANFHRGIALNDCQILLFYVQRVIVCNQRSANGTDISRKDDQIQTKCDVNHSGCIGNEGSFRSHKQFKNFANNRNVHQHSQYNGSCNADQTAQNIEETEEARTKHGGLLVQVPSLTLVGGRIHNTNQISHGAARLAKYTSMSRHNPNNQSRANRHSNPEIGPAFCDQCLKLLQLQTFHADVCGNVRNQIIQKQSANNDQRNTKDGEDGRQNSQELLQTNVGTHGKQAIDLRRAFIRSDQLPRCNGRSQSERKR